MAKLDTPDLCARLDSLKKLCDRLESAQSNPKRYRDLIQRIRIETQMFQTEVVAYLPATARLCKERAHVNRLS